MKGFTGIVLFCAMIGLIVCGLSGFMWFLGIGTPNCEPTTIAYAEFYATMFGCGFLACFSGWCLLAIACVADKFFVNKVK